MHKGYSNKLLHRVLIAGYVLDVEEPAISLQPKAYVSNNWRNLVPITVIKEPSRRARYSAEKAIITAAEKLDAPQYVIVAKSVLNSIRNPEALHYAIAPDLTQFNMEENIFEIKRFIARRETP